LVHNIVKVCARCVQPVHCCYLWASIAALTALSGSTAPRGQRRFAPRMIAIRIFMPLRRRTTPRKPFMMD